ncbi:helix-turn-helix transcriptional regulator [Ilumatobacter nonamiensis]|uniref:helix-turn-helix transcriptional regulator n=1 Tax=Ilumatobacter nonamiensis TaxID=467093 RepID=UPI00034518E5|nr:WYL domain-containing protein [Ilumatobacter nonamiensis]
MADRVERLTNLLAVLLETRVGLSLSDIADSMDGQYPADEKARRQAFERDKSALREIGVPIDTEVRTGDHLAGQTRYRIDRAKYELDDLDLAPDEMRALQVAVATMRTDSDLGREALLKLGGPADAVDRPPVSAVLPDRPELPLVRSAVSTRSVLEFVYRDERRTVEPWGVLLRGGFWYLVGHDRLRSAKRTFRIDRIDGDIEVGEPGSFERPANFDPRAAFPADPKQIGHAVDDAVEATVRIAAVRAPAIERELGHDRIVARHTDGSIDVRVPADNLDAFRSWVLGLVDQAEVLGPPEVRTFMIDWLRGVAASVDGRRP